MGTNISRTDNVVMKISENVHPNNANTVKLLLLGPADSGKSTIIKQMKILHANGFSEADFRAQASVITASVLRSIQCVLKAMDSEMCDTNAQSYANLLSSKTLEAPFDAHTLSTVRAIWKNKKVQEKFEYMCAQRENQLLDPDQYFLNSIERICQPNYVPSVDDMLHSRVSTTGIVETSFTLKHIYFRVFDVGGQRSERKKWIHCFDDVSAIMFVAALTDYADTLQECKNTNRMHESVRLFHSVSTSKWLINASMILFLNKLDLFEKKIALFPITNAYPNYGGETTGDKVIQFIKELFLAQCSKPKNQIFTYLTCATDTKQMEHILDASIEIITQNNFKDCGIY